jgi:aminoglycoside 2'-N-acetyltransferase I
VDVQVAHTAQLDARTLSAVRQLLGDVFGGETTAEAWDHALGGMHALVLEDGRLVAHGSVIHRRLWHGGRTWRSGQVEGVAVRAEMRGRGYGAAVMGALEQLIRGGYELGVLGASEMGEGFYRHRGWKLWQGATSTLMPDGSRRATEDEVFVLEVASGLDLSGELTCGWREGHVW